MKTKRFLTLLLTLAMVFCAFAGCSNNSSTDEKDGTGVNMDDVQIDIPNGDDKDNTENPGNSDKVNKGDNIDDIPKELRGTTVTVACWGDENGSEYLKVQKKFTEKTGIKVKWLVYGQSEYESKIVTQINANQGPDIIIQNAGFPIILEAAQELPSYFDLNDGFWDPRVSDGCSVNGKRYFVNSYRSPFPSSNLVFYNKKIFNDNGITSPADYIKQGNGSWSYENLYQCLVDVKKVGKIGGIVDPMTLAQQRGSGMITYDPATSKFASNINDKKLLETLQWYAKCFEEGLINNSFRTIFANGQIGLCMTDIFGAKFNGYFKDMAPSDIGLVPLPDTFNGEKLEYLPSINRGYGIAKGAKNPKGAYYFLRYYLDYNNYDDADANIFANKVMEKYYQDYYLNSKTYKSPKISWTFFEDVLTITGGGWYSDDWKSVKDASVGQVSVELKKMANVCDNAVNEANAKLKNFAK